ncbi:MAG: hypothetical protein ABSH48_05025 [Verrucomicrobiota bacterium]
MRVTLGWKNIQNDERGGELKFRRFCMTRRRLFVLVLIRFPKLVMEKFANWLAGHSKSRPAFVSDNLAFDWQFINYYFHRFIGRNPFRFSGRRIGDLYAGLLKTPQRRRNGKGFGLRHTAIIRWMTPRETLKR